jgi:hypothetical protein
MEAYMRFLDDRLERSAKELKSKTLEVYPYLEDHEVVESMNDQTGVTELGYEDLSLSLRCLLRYTRRQTTEDPNLEPESA